MQGTQEVKLPEQPFQQIEDFEKRMEPEETLAGDAKKSENEAGDFYRLYRVSTPTCVQLTCSPKYLSVSNLALWNASWSPCSLNARS